MQNIKCPICTKKSIDPINLRCQHHPCYRCASQLLCTNEQNNIETRYFIICPICTKKTITYDLRHLIINQTQQDQDLFVTNKYINKKPQIIAKKYHHLIENDTLLSKRNSIQQTNPPFNKIIAIDCNKHPNNKLYYFCIECSKNDTCSFFCTQCIKTHKHRVLTIDTARDKLLSQNQKKRKQYLPTRKKMLDQILYSLTHRRQSIGIQYENLLKQIAQQFKKIHHYLNSQFQFIKNDIKMHYSKQNQQLKNTIALADKFKDHLTNLDKFNASARNQIQSEVHFAISVSDLEHSLQTNRGKLTSKYPLPTIINRVTPLLTTIPKLFEIQQKKQKISYQPLTPCNSSRNNHYNIDHKTVKNQFILETNNCCLPKQNNYPIDANQNHQNFNNFII